jgi:hypothetical protein
MMKSSEEADAQIGGDEHHRSWSIKFGRNLANLTQPSVSSNPLPQFRNLAQPSPPTALVLLTLVFRINPVFLKLQELESHKQCASRLMPSEIQHAYETPPRRNIHQAYCCNGEDWIPSKAVIALDHKA